MKSWLCPSAIVVLGVGYLAIGPVEPARLRPALPPNVQDVTALPPGALPGAPVCTGPRCRNLYVFRGRGGGGGRVWIGRDAVQLPYAFVRQRCWTSCGGIDGGESGRQVHAWSQYAAWGAAPEQASVDELLHAGPDSSGPRP